LFLLPDPAKELFMQVRDIMTGKPVCCTPDMSVQRVALLMIEHDCGEIPVVEHYSPARPVGVITDRDIACRAVAKGKDPSALHARDIMSSPVVTVRLDTDIEECCKVMETAQIRRIPVVDHNGNCCGILSQADIACKGPVFIAAEVLRDVSRPSGGSSFADRISNA
jgi:CBS domain-containing protein